VLGVVHSRVARFFANPMVAAVNFAGSMVVFYYTPLFGLALSTYLGHLLMIVHFTLAGYLFANALVGVDPGPTRPGYPVRLLLLFTTMAFHAFFGLALVSGQTLLVPEWFGLLGRPWGPPALADQQAGGGIAWGISELPMLALAIALAVAWTRDDERTARRRDRAADRYGDTELIEYNAMLARLASGDAPDADADADAHPPASERAPSDG
jgi:putative copper resistance protein D